MKRGVVLVVGCIALLAVTSLSGCDSSYRDRTKQYTALPTELRDCSFYDVTPTGASGAITVVRCPSSTTTTQYSVGKTKAETVVVDAPASTNEKKVIVIDGVTYTATDDDQTLQ